MYMHNDHEIFISVIVPVYNVEAYVEDCLESLVAQTEPFKEIVLVNDGSEDNSKKICEEYCSRYENMILINQENQGLSAARNTGLKYAKGNYIIFVDSDDYVALNMNECIQKVFEENDVDILYYNADVIDEVDGAYAENLVRSDFLNGHIMSGMEFLEKSFPNNYRASSCLAAFKKSFLDKHKLVFPFGLYYEDNIFFMQTVLRAKKILCIPDCFYIRRLRKGSIMTGPVGQKKCLDHIAVNLMIWKELYNYVDRHKYQKFYKKYISIRLIYTFIFIEGFEKDKAVYEKMQIMMDFFIKEWLPIYDLDSLNWDEACALRSVTNLLSNNEKENNLKKRLECVRVNEAVDRMLIEKFGILPLTDSYRKVGIYGIGKHTRILLEMYQRYVGKIDCDLFFIVSEKKQDVYMGKQVKSCNEIPNDADIIISSRIYEEEMKATLLKNKIKRNKIISIYDSDPSSIGDLIMLAETDKEYYK